MEDMTQTQQPGPTPGLDREHLRDYAQLRRSTTDRKVAGVAGGLGRHLNVDPTVLRVTFVVLAFFGGAGLLLYGALWLFVPEDGTDRAPVDTSSGTRNAVLVAVAVLAGLLVLGDAWGPVGFPWPLVLLALVVAAVLVTRDSRRTPAGPASGAPQAADPPAAGEEPTVALPAGPATTAGGHPADPAGPADPADPGRQGPPPPVPPAGAYPPAPQGPPAPARRRRGPVLFWPTLALLALALGTLGLFDVGGLDVPDTAYPTLALAVVGLMLVVGAWYGRPGGLILLGLLAALVRFGMSAGDHVADDTPSRLEAPVTAVQVAERYAIPAGSLHLDLSNVRDVERLDGRTVHVEANAGRLLVTVPDDVDVEVVADLGIVGGIDVAGRTHGGPGASLHQVIDGGADAPEMTLDLDLGVGAIEVRQ